MNSSKIAVVQASPALFDKERGVKEILRWCRQAKQEGANLVLFPESLIPGYPRGLSFGAPVGDRKPWGRMLWQRFAEASMEIPGPETKTLCELAADLHIYLALGVTERDRISGTLYCTLLIISPEGIILHKHRKLKPTGAERIIWGEGNGSTLKVHPTEIGRLGGLICWENYMPLARMALYQQGIQIYLAPTADQRDGWQHTLRHIALEGRCYVLGCNQFVTKSMYPADLPGLEELTEYPEIMSRGGSVIIDPLGEVIAGPLWDQSGILYGQIELSAITRAKLDFDPIGHYHRPDVFDFKLNK